MPSSFKLIFLGTLSLFVLAACLNHSTDNHLMISMPANTQQTIVLHNTGSKSLILNHPTPNPGASAGWASKIAPNHWSILVLQNNKPRERHFLINCHHMKDDDYQFQKMNCSQYLSNQHKHIQLPKKLTKNGSFWLTENKPLAKLNKALKKRGVNLSQKQQHRLGLSSSQS